MTTIDETLGCKTCGRGDPVRRRAVRYYAAAIGVMGIVMLLLGLNGEAAQVMTTVLM